MKKLLQVVALLAAFALPSFAQVNSYDVDPAHSAAQFSVRHLGISTVRGQFSKVTGKIQVDEKDATKSQIDVTIDVNTLDTREPNRDKDVKSENFLDAAKYPAMTFKSKNISAVTDGKLKMTGDLTIHGVTREVTFDVDGPSPAIKDPWGNLRRGAQATAKINRKDFGVSWNKVMDNGGMVVGDELTITIDLEMTRKP
ncbi:MAG: polyisoprenoid-binding protein [Acidipila sp.]|nr:polyisoprenoid-binding protein [Acidipila sp.]